MNEQRFIDLESKYLHQELLLEDLHQVLYRQQETIDKLETSLKRLVKHIQEGAGTEQSPINEPPPHY